MNTTKRVALYVNNNYKAFAGFKFNTLSQESQGKGHGIWKKLQSKHQASFVFAKYVLAGSERARENNLSRSLSMRLLRKRRRMGDKRKKERKTEERKVWNIPMASLISFSERAAVQKLNSSMTKAASFIPVYASPWFETPTTSCQN